MKAGLRVRIGGDLTHPLPVMNRMKQGCILTPSLFGLFFAAMLEKALRGSSNGVFMHFCSGELFILHLRVNTKVIQVLIQELLYSDDCALMAHSDAALQDLITCFVVVAKNFGLTISQMKITPQQCY